MVTINNHKLLRSIAYALEYQSYRCSKNIERENINKLIVKIFYKILKVWENLIFLGNF